MSVLAAVKQHLIENCPDLEGRVSTGIPPENDAIVKPSIYLRMFKRKSTPSEALNRSHQRTSVMIGTLLYLEPDHLELETFLNEVLDEALQGFQPPGTYLPLEHEEGDLAEATINHICWADAWQTSKIKKI